MRAQPSLAWHVAAFGVYAAVAVIFIDHGRSLTGGVAGYGSDPFDFIWTLAWWPWAIAHHLNPLHSSLLWQPLGVYTLWVASLPLLSLLGLPFTLLSGPVLTFNVWILIAPVLSAWFAYRLCLRVSGDPAAAMLGGYVFGFSSYEMAQDVASLNLSVTFLLPALLLVILRRLDDDISRARTVVLAGVILVCQFLIGSEVFTSFFFFGGIAWLLALYYLPARRQVLRRLLVDGLVTGPFVAVVLSPCLVSMFSHFHYLNLPAAWPYYFTADLLNLVVPGRENFFFPVFGRLAANFHGDVAEVDAYLGLPLIAVVVLYARRHGAAGDGRFLIVMFLSLLVLSFGPLLWIGGGYTRLVMPWMVFVHVPVLSFMLPTRFALFVSLVSAVIVALWVADPDATTPRGRRLALGLLACLVLLPRPMPWQKIPYSTFFAPGEVRAQLGPNARIMILPFAIQGPSGYWQTESRFDFIQTGGYVGFPPLAMQKYPAVQELFGGNVDDVVLNDLKAFVQGTNTQYIVAGPGTAPALLAKIDQLNWRRRDVDDVVIYTVPEPDRG